MTGDLIKILDSITDTGLYVVEEESHVILYHNKRMQEVVPGVKVGAVCSDVWPGTCLNCPLKRIEASGGNHIISYNNPFGDVVDITTSRILWEDRIQAVVIMIMPHDRDAGEEFSGYEIMQLTKAAAKVYSLVFSVNLNQNTYYALECDSAMMDNTPQKGNFDDLLESGALKIHPNYRELFCNKFKRETVLKSFANGKEEIELEYMHRHDDGLYHWISANMVPIENLYSDDMLAIIMCRNIDKEKMQEEKYTDYLKTRNEGNMQLLQMALAGTSIYEFYFYPLMGRIINSKRLCEKFQLPLEIDDIPGSFAFLSFIAEEYRMGMVETFEGILKGQKKESYTFKTKDDKYWIRTNISAVSVNAQGHPTYAVGTMEDITREREHEKQLQTLTQRNKEILFSVSGLYYSINSVDLEKKELTFIKTEQDIENLNIKTKDYFHVMHALAFGLYHPEDADRFLSDFSLDKLNENWSIGKDRFSGEYRRKVGDEWHRVSCTAYFMNKEYNNKVVILALQDIHEQYLSREYEREQEKKKEQETKQLLEDALSRAERANDAKSDFLSRMSHDIRTPMNAIIGMASLAENYIDNKEKVRECIGKINMAGQHLMDLINEVLDMSKIESGKMDMEMEEFNLLSLLQNMLSVIRPLIEQKKQQLIVNISNVVHEEVIGDRLRLQQVFNNIMMNAHKYTNAGGIINFKVEELPSNNIQNGCYRFIFKDTGIGIAKDYLPHIFEPFSRAADSRISKVVGTGLGMTITNNIVNMMNGDIQVESVWGEGSTFTVTLPFMIKEIELLEAEELAGKKILVVDDEETCRENICRILEELAIQYDTAECGQEAIDKVKESIAGNQPYACMIIDWAMPGLDGVETAEIIQKIPGADHVVVILSAYDWSSIAVDAGNAGVVDFLAKPLCQEALVDLLCKVCRRTEEPEKKEENNPNTLAGQRVLIVEDNEINMEIACEMIGMLGADIEKAEDGQEALAKVQASPDGFYRLIFMDIRMPVMNGYEATQAIRQLDRKDAALIPIIAMTADAFSDDVRKAFSAGMNEHLSKPIDMQSVKRVMEKWMS